MLSILITHYNRPYALGACLQSIYELDLEIPYEIVVSDDGSTKENQTIIKEFKIDKLVLSKRNCGLTSSLNNGIKACNGTHLLYCQEDSIVLPILKS